MRYQTSTVISFIIAILLLGAIFYAGALTQPYSGETEPYYVAHESTEAFNKTIEKEDAAPGDWASVDEFSENERRAFENAKEQPPEESDYRPDGWRSLGAPPVCDDALLVCDEYEEVPDPSDGNVKYTLVEDSSGEMYLVQVGFDEGPGAVWNVDGLVESFTKLFIVGPYVLFLVYREWPRSSRQPTRVSMGYGAGLAIIVYAYPYLVMFADASPPSWYIGTLAVITWVVILVEIGRGYWQRD